MIDEGYTKSVRNRVTVILLPTLCPNEEKRTKFIILPYFFLRKIKREIKEGKKKTQPDG